MRMTQNPPLHLAHKMYAARPREMDELRTSRDSEVKVSDYMQAAEAQRQLERQKKDEEGRKLEALAEKHAAELQELERVHAADFQRASAQWEYELTELRHTMDTAEIILQTRHREEQEAFHKYCVDNPPRPKFSRQLLNMRCQEEHLLKQCKFPQAAKIKLAADALEEREYEAALGAHQARQEAEERKMLTRQAKEADAQRRKFSAQHDEKLLAQERELDKLMKRLQAAKLGLARTQAQERLILEQAIKGWYNPRKFAPSPPPLLTPPPHSLPPGQRVQLQRPKRPETAPGKMVHMGSQPPSTPGTTTTGAPESADQWPDSPIDGVLQPRPRKPWETPTDATSTTSPRGSTPARPQTVGGPIPPPKQLNKALLPREHATHVGPANPYIVSMRTPSNSNSSGSSRSPVSTPPAPPQVGGMALPAKQPQGQGGLTKDALKAHTRMTSGPAQQHFASPSRTPTSLPSRGAIVGGSSIQSASQLASPKVLVMHS